MDSKKIGIIVAVATALLCGCPGLLICGTGALSMFGSQMPEVLAQTGASASDAMTGGVMFVVVGGLLMAIPLVAGIIAWRLKPASAEDMNMQPPSVEM